MLLLQNLMLEKLANKEVVVDEVEIFTQALGGKRSGHARGMEKFVIPTPSSSSQSLYGTQLNLELEETNRKIVELQNELVEKDRKRDEQIEELQNALLEKDRKRDEQIEEIRQESKCQFDLLMSRVLGKMVVWHICFVMI
jgi:hypothetical protein